MLFGSRVGCGIVYELSPPVQKGGDWTETVLYNFQGNTDGQLPIGDLVFDKQGNLYGATQYGGGFGSCNAPFDQHCGTVFELSPPKTKGSKWTEKVLYGFKGGTDGANPNGGLVFDTNGGIYGTTEIGGDLQGECQPNGCGAVFTLAPPATKGGAWTNKMLHRFNGQDGAAPLAGVVFGGNGSLYGTDSAGGKTGWGAVFELGKPSGKIRSWTETVLHSFRDGNDGANPAAGLVFDARGNLYGTTNIATSQSARGNVFELKPPGQKGGNWAFSVIYTFKVIPDGERPGSDLVFDAAGDLYGTTQDGGSGTACSFYGCGTVFEVSP
jgi:hypothetical protein